MVTLFVDEAYAFDFLSILEVKANKIHTLDTQKNLSNYINAFNMQFGEKKMAEIRSSPEYAKLYEANSTTFDLVDKAKTDSCKASDVDRANYERCKARKALQDRFFPERSITETKVGYEVYDNGTA